jgi:hypothetical protein
MSQNYFYRNKNHRRENKRKEGYLFLLPASRIQKNKLFEFLHITTGSLNIIENVSFMLRVKHIFYIL